jgi:uncharacterized coiled-coil DUF342 family protein
MSQNKQIRKNEYLKKFNIQLNTLVNKSNVINTRTNELTKRVDNLDIYGKDVYKSFKKFIPSLIKQVNYNNVLQAKIIGLKYKIKRIELSTHSSNFNILNEHQMYEYIVYVEKESNKEFVPFELTRVNRIKTCTRR